MDSLVLALEDVLWQKRDREGDQNLSDEEFVVLSVEALEREVNNGGYNQFFFNPSNEFAKRIIADLERIGCRATARITAQAIAVLELDSLDPDVLRERAADADDRLDEALGDLDNAYYAEAEDIEGKLFAFARQNKESFSIP